MRYILLFLFISHLGPAQSIGVQLGLTTVTPTGNNDQFDFDFLESLSPAYQLGLMGNFELSNVIILKPSFICRKYAIKKNALWHLGIYSVQQSYTTLSGDLNFDIELTNSLSLIFGMGMDYIISLNLLTVFNETEDSFFLELSDMDGDQRLDPYANIGLCYKFTKRLFLNLDYRHLLDNWDTETFSPGTLFVNSNNGSVKLHMLNLSIGFLI